MTWTGMAWSSELRQDKLMSSLLLEPLQTRWLLHSVKSTIRCLNPDGYCQWAVALTVAVTTITHTRLSEDATELFQLIFTSPDVLQLPKLLCTEFCSCKRKSNV